MNPLVFPDEIAITPVINEADDRAAINYDVLRAIRRVLVLALSLPPRHSRRLEGENVMLEGGKKEI